MQSDVFSGIALSQPSHDNTKIFLISATQNIFSERPLETQLPFLPEVSVNPIIVSVMWQSPNANFTTGQQTTDIALINADVCTDYTHAIQVSAYFFLLFHTEISTPCLWAIFHTAVPRLGFTSLWWIFRGISYLEQVCKNNFTSITAQEHMETAVKGDYVFLYIML